ncbi:hypothetical protein T02_15231 [Trichinella nativa]|uniref:Uncharacterized protein n=1 Tax=Trichinella nativa TaxID=6335 RepID=A0A0V1KGT7_9BILA|nr:hypothetical protein T02_15231 [Trichinella nativa]
MTNNIHFASVYSDVHLERCCIVLPCSHWEPICLPLLQ